MNRVFLIACSKRKLSKPAPAGELYASPLFQMSLAYAQQQKPDAIFVLSALHGLIPVEQVVTPYNVTLSGRSHTEKAAWSKQVIRSLPDPLTTEFTFLAGKNYYQPLLPHLPHVQLPLEGLGLGKRLHFLKSQLS